MKKLSKKKIREAVRVVGYLLETNGTTKAFARGKNGKEVDRFSSKACKFCLAGATDMVATKFLGIAVDDYETREIFEEKVFDIISPVTHGSGISTWDTGGETARAKIVEILKTYD